ncbi:MAG: hypothetical protein HQL82_01870 [Magnetococcales bacterium]|nr:hypothetical protein [Magnetococcales bacterium]
MFTPLGLGRLALVSAGCAIFYILTGMSLTLGSQTSAGSLQANETYGPIVIDRPGRIVDIRIHVHNLQQSWANVEVELYRGQDRETPLLVLAGEQYHESGSDDEGQWVESEGVTDKRLVLDEPGDYYLTFAVAGGTMDSVEEGTDQTATSRLGVEITTLRGSSALFNRGAIALLVLALLFNHQANRLDLPPRMAGFPDPGRGRQGKGRRHEP